MSVTAETAKRRRSHKALRALLFECLEKKHLFAASTGTYSVEMNEDQEWLDWQSGLFSNIDNSDGSTLTVKGVNGVPIAPNDWRVIVPLTGSVRGQTIMVGLLHATIDGNVNFQRTASLDFLSADEVLTVGANVEVESNGSIIDQPFRLTFNGQNDAPISLGVFNVTLNEGQEWLDWQPGLLSRLTDPDGGSLQVVSVNEVPIASNDWRAIVPLSSTINGQSIVVGELHVTTNGFINFQRTADLSSIAGGKNVSATANILISDGNGGTAIQVLQLNLASNNSAPVSSAAIYSSVFEDQEWLDWQGGVFSSIRDANGDRLRVVGVNGISMATDNWRVIVPISAAFYDETIEVGLLHVTENGYFNFQRTANLDAIRFGDTITADVADILVSDNNGGTVNQALVVIIDGENDAPISSGTFEILLNEDQEWLGWQEGIFSSVTDVDGDQLSVISVNDRPISAGDSEVIVPLSGSINGQSITLGDLHVTRDGLVNFQRSVESNLIPAGQIVEVTANAVISDEYNGRVNQPIRVQVIGRNSPPVSSGPILKLMNAEQEWLGWQAGVFTNIVAQEGVTLSVSSVNGIGMPVDDWRVIVPLTASMNGQTIELGQLHVTRDGNLNFQRTGDLSSLGLDQSITAFASIVIIDGEGETATQDFVLEVRRRALGEVSALTVPGQGQSGGRLLTFRAEGDGVALPMLWGVDTSWSSSSNMLRSINFMDESNVDIVRAAFTVESPLINGRLAPTEQALLDERIQILSLVGRPLNLSLAVSADHPQLHESFRGNPENYLELLKVFKRAYESAGHTVVTVAPFNEPDFVYTGLGTQQEFLDFARLLRADPEFAGVRISGPNTLDPDNALAWYNFLNSEIDEGNTHQLAGSFDSYASFFQTVRANGDYATNDELHNVMEGIVGAEYGVQTGIWWGSASLARGEFVKATDGVRLGYAENRPAWTAAAVYRNSDGEVQLFGGSSERQAVDSDYHVVSLDRDVWFDGQGPTREYHLRTPGGTGYQIGQSNAERVVNVTWGDDIPQAVGGRYVLVNKNSGKVLQVDASQSATFANVSQGDYDGLATQHWDVTQLTPEAGGDYSGFTIVPESNATFGLDNLGFSLQVGSNIGISERPVAEGFPNQQWFFDYAGDGWFEIRNMWSGHSVNVFGASTAEGANVGQWIAGPLDNQLWRLLPVGADIEFVAPNPPTGLTAVANAESVMLSWSPSTSADTSSYTILRSRSLNGEYDTIARGVTGTRFLDNRITSGSTYYYKIQAVDGSLNRSIDSTIASATPSGEPDLVLRLALDGNSNDFSINQNNATIRGAVSYVDGRIGTAIQLSGNSSLQLPYVAPHQESITVATWVRWDGGAASQRIFDFGNGESQSLALTPSSYSNTLQFAIWSGPEVYIIDAQPLVVGQWTHVAVTLDSGTATLYVNGNVANQASGIRLSAAGIQPVLNYIGRSQFPFEPLLNGAIDDFRMYNHALTQRDLADIMVGNEIRRNLVTNSSFESPDVAVGSMVAVDAVFLEGWQSLEGELLELDGTVANGVVSTNDTRQRNLDHYSAATTNKLVNEIVQEIETVFGVVYELSFKLKANNVDLQDEDEVVFVEWNGQQLNVADLKAEKVGEWTRITTTLTGTGNLDRLVLRQSAVPSTIDGSGPLLDDITLLRIE